MRRWPLVLVALFAGTAAAQPPPGAVDEPDGLDHPALAGAEGGEAEAGCTDDVAATLDPAPLGRAVSELSAEACLGLLDRRGVPFRRIDHEDSHGVGIPIVLTGRIGGLTVEQRGGSEVHEILDCRLAVALLEWAPTLRGLGFTALRHYSVYRPGARVGGTGHVSGHAHGLAIDVGRFEREGGTTLSVLEHWESRERGRDPCAEGHVESEASAQIRSAVCEAVRRDLFQVVLTPHHDRSHQNHLHLEVRPGVGWSYVR